MRMKKATLVAVLGLAACGGWALAEPTAPKPAPVEVRVSTQAKAILSKHGMTLQGGVLRKQGAKDGSDLAFGGGPVVCIVHPDDEAALVVGSYNRGVRLSMIMIDFSSLPAYGPVLTPEKPSPVLNRLLPEKLAPQAAAARSAIQPDGSGKAKAPRR